jgi:lipopolysaccharide/colanic/teichoic acid biosynthesis glycosyltransferase
MAQGAIIEQAIGGLRLYPAVKRTLDVVVSALGLAVSLPLWALVGLAVVLENGRPIFYTQSRVGMGGRVFRVLKFRSMIREAEKYSGPVLAEADDPRITHIGRLLRKTAMDELPQVWNILKGDMSFVGPRPERPEFVWQFASRVPGYALRHQVRPGLTGMAQVYKHYTTEPEEKLVFDLLYIRRCSLLVDAMLFFKSWGNTLLGRWGAG